MATVEATMHAVHQLRNNPPPLGASPSAVEQWRHDIDQLIIVAINTPPLGGGGDHRPPVGHSCTPTPPQAPWALCVSSATHPPFAARQPSVVRPPSVARAPSAARVPSGPWVPVMSIAMGNLCDELRRHEGKTVMSPLSTGERGVVTSNPITLRRILALIHQYVKFQGHGLDTPPTPQQLREGAWHSLHTSAWWSSRPSSGPPAGEM
jgi:hypothetical protein